MHEAGGGLVRLQCGKAATRMRYRAEHARWQKAANAVWKRHPEWGKRAVAKVIKPELGLKLTPKHVASKLRKP